MKTLTIEVDDVDAETIENALCCRYGLEAFDEDNGKRQYLSDAGQALAHICRAYMEAVDIFYKTWNTMEDNPREDQ